MAKSNDLMVDGDLVRALAALLQETGLSEIEFAVGDRRIRVVRAALAAPGVALSGPAAPIIADTAAATELPGAVKAPMVGTAYLGPQPGAPPFIRLGETLREGQVMLVIEAMKVMNQILAPRGGRVAQILVADATPVEYGQPLVVLE